MKLKPWQYEISFWYVQNAISTRRSFEMPRAEDEPEKYLLNGNVRGRSSETWSCVPPLTSDV